MAMAARGTGRLGSGGGGDPLGLLMLGFDGIELPAVMAERLRAAPAAGITLFRALNVETAGQLRDLTASIQAAATAGRPSAGPLLVAADQEGGQLLALGDVVTAFAGNMAIGATADPDLAARVGRATGLELRALGVNVAYAPSCDLATNPDNPGIGIRSFGSEAGAAAGLAAATIAGLRSAGVAATAKHFPGLGDAAADSHHGLPVLTHDGGRLRLTELVPFRAAIDAGVELVMSAHVALPGFTGEPAVAATLSRAVMHDLLRSELSFDGLAVSDALDMAALPQGDDQVNTVLGALEAGIDLLLCPPDGAARLRIEAGLTAAFHRGALDTGALDASHAGLERLRTWLAAQPTPGPEIVGCGEHRELARELAERSVTLVRDDAGLLPLRLAADTRVVAIMPRPEDLTPADTSSLVAPGLATALRSHHPRVEEHLVPVRPGSGDIDGLRSVVGGADLVVVGTIAASLHPEQARLVDAVLATGVPAVTVALRTPFDLAAYPASRTHACTYGILPGSLAALASALFGRIAFRGRLPAAVPGLAAVGHGLMT
jgi:beta-N-acetylhexosaminidase